MRIGVATSANVITIEYGSIKQLKNFILDILAIVLKRFISYCIIKSF